MNEFNRQELFIPPEIQKLLAKKKVAIFGVGLGSIIAECLIRSGIKNLTIVDGDFVELSNLNRQNYTIDDLSKFKADCLFHRLNKIYSNLNIKAYNFYLTKDNIEPIMEDADIIINTIDFDHEAFLLCHNLCKTKGILEIFPMNLALGSAVIISDKTSPSFDVFFNTLDVKDSLINFVINNMSNKEKIYPYLIKYNEIKNQVNYKDPQIGIGSYLNAAIISTLIIKLLKNNDLKLFPFVYNLNLEIDL
jgi:molybdopterin/thiamine biosynthesis adenylyltransferase